MGFDPVPFLLKRISECYTAYQASAYTNFATEASGKVGWCTSISACRSLLFMC